MMNLINAIPEHIGWIMVGAVGMLTFEMCALLIGTAVEVVRDYLTDDYDDEESEVC